MRSGDGADERRILDVGRMSTDPAELAAASAAAAAGDLLLLDGQEIPVFDLRAPTAGKPKDRRPGADVAAGDAVSGCLLIGSRGGVRVALLVD